MGNTCLCGDVMFTDGFRNIREKYDFSEEDLEEWRDIFVCHCDKDKHLTVKEFYKVYNKKFRGDPGPYVQHLFRTFDGKKKGFVDLRGFLIGIGRSTAEGMTTKLDWAFSMYDINGDGYITKSEIFDIVCAMFTLIYGTNTTVDIVVYTDDLCKEIGLKGSDVISKSEFCDLGSGKYEKLLDLVHGEIPRQTRNSSEVVTPEFP